jgi:AcrR family transcriptional regulator
MEYFFAILEAIVEAILEAILEATLEATLEEVNLEAILEAILEAFLEADRSADRREICTDSAEPLGNNDARTGLPDRALQTEMVQNRNGTSPNLIRALDVSSKNVPCAMRLVGLIDIEFMRRQAVISASFETSNL